MGVEEINLTEYSKMKETRVETVQSKYTQRENNLWNVIFWKEEQEMRNRNMETDVGKNPLSYQILDCYS